MGFALGLRTKINFCRWRCEPRSTGEIEFARRAMGGLVVAGADGKKMCQASLRRKGRHG